MTASQPRAQENPNAIPEGETPHNVTLLCYDPMTDATKPGDRITVTGICKGARAATFRVFGFKP